MNYLKISNLNFVYGGNKVLQDVSLTAEKSQLVAILGASGAGKSTLLRLIAGFEKPSSGEISLAGKTFVGIGNYVLPEKRKIGIVPQDAALFPHLSVEDNIAFGLKGQNERARNERVRQLLELVKLVDFAKRMPDQLSGGQAQRVALARALAPKPDLILLDEPFSALDAELRQQLRNDIFQVLKAEQATAILVTHDQEEALSLADKVAVLRDGKIVQSGPPAELYNNPADLGIATFLGDSVLIDGQVSSGKVVTSLGRLTALNQVKEGERGVVAIRSENFYLQPNPNGEGEVVGRVFFGHDAILDVQLPTIKIHARSNGPFAPEVGMRVNVWVRGSVNFYPSSHA